MGTINRGEVATNNIDRQHTVWLHVRNVDIWKEANMYPMAEFLREKRLRWFGHVQRRDKDDAMRKILQMTVDGK